MEGELIGLNHGKYNCPECNTEYILHPDDEGLNNIICDQCRIKFQVEVIVYCNAFVSIPETEHPTK